MKYRCRSLKPKLLDWIEIDAESVADAVQEYHDRHDHCAGGQRLILTIL